MHKTSEPSILYFGTPVVLISSEIEETTFRQRVYLCVPARFKHAVISNLGFISLQNF